MKRRPSTRRALRRAALVAAISPLASTACGPEGKSTPPDRSPPTSTAYVATRGAATPLTSAGVLLSADRATVTLELDEPGAIYYTRDGSEPVPGAANTGVGGQTLSLNLAEDVELRYFGVDLAGNREGTVHQTHVFFDHTAPEATVDPLPVGQDVFPGPIVVHIESDETSTIYYTLDGSLPVPEGATTVAVADRVDLPLAHTTQVWFRVLDAARNQFGPVSLTYRIDDVAPRTVAEPPGGRSLGPLEVRLFSDDPSAAIHYTLDGSEPDASSPVWANAVTVAETTTVRFRGIDPGGNLESVRSETYEIGPLGARTPVAGAEPDHVALTGQLDLGAALLRAAGRAAGLADRPGLDAVSYELWAAAEAALDAALTHSHAGYSALYAPLNTTLAHSAAGEPDRDGNTSNLEETLAARLVALAAVAGTEPPRGLYPLALPFLGANSELLRDPGADRRADGLPAWEDDAALLTWQGSAGEDRSISAAGLHAFLNALAARALAATTAEHVADASAYARDVGPVVALRCGGCHGAGQAAPDLSTAAGLAPLVDPAAPEASRLLALLTRAEAHPSQPVTPEQAAAIRAWIAAGAPPPAPGPVSPGLTPRLGFAAGLALQQADWALDWTGRKLGYDADRLRVDALGSNGVRYVPALVRAEEEPGVAGLPRVPDRFGVLDGAFELGPQARGLEAALALVAVDAARPGLRGRFDLLTQGAALGAIEYARNLAPQLAARTYVAADDTLRDRTEPNAAAGGPISAEAVGDALAAFAAARAAGLLEAGLADARIGALLAESDGLLLREDGWYRTMADPARAPARGERAELGPQLALLRGLLAVSADRPEAAEAARRLWGRLGTVFDPEAGAWQTSFGDATYVYTPGLAARAVEALDAALRAGLSDAEAFLQAFAARVIVPHMRASETWLCGEVSTAPDDDLDGVAKPESVPVGRGVAPAFLREIRFE